MPSLGAITLADGQGTPSNYVFSPDTINGSVVHFNDGNDPQDFQCELQTSVNRAKKKGETSVVTTIIRVPVLDSTGTETTGKYDQVRIEYRFPFESAELQRKNTFAFCKNLHANASFKTLVEQIQSWYA